MGRASYLALIAATALSACGSGNGPQADARTAACPEIFASGFRNPWRWSFDRATGDLWVGDVGQGEREEVDRVVRGGNYGWRCVEGTLPTGLACGSAPNLLPPVAEYGRAVGRSITGGFVYRGRAIAGLAGEYVFGDYATHLIFHVPAGTSPTVQVTSGLDSRRSISSFGEDNDGELYVVDLDGGLYRLNGTVSALTVDRVFTALTFAQPVALLQAPGDASRWFVLEKAGVVRVFSNDPAVAAASAYLDIRGRVDAPGEMGLLGMAFHPRFPADPRVFVSYTNQDADRVSRISEFRSNDDGATLDASSERILLVVGQPESNHNGGNIAFGPDGYLYIGFGDGGGSNDRHGAIGNGQRMSTLLGKMLRIDVNAPAPYGIPAGNPFAGSPPCGIP